MSIAHKLAIVLEQHTKVLNHKFWDEAQSLHSDIREKLLQIAKDFADEHYLPNDAISDIILTGSIANYNWSRYSDVDLHIVADFSEINKTRELVDDYFRVAKTLWNSNHTIDMCGHEVEIYVQDKSEPHYSSGVYSVMHGEWVKKPSLSNAKEPDTKAITKKSQSFIERIDDVSEMVEAGKDARDAAEKLKERIKKMRLSGLQRGGEQALENLVFKNLRNNGHLDRLATLRKKAYDQEMSVDCTVSEATLPTAKPQQNPQQPQQNPQQPQQNPQQPQQTPPTEIVQSQQALPGQQPQPDPFAATQTWTAPPKDQPYGQQMVDAHYALENIRADHLKNMPLDKKLELVLQKSTEAEKISYRALRGISDFDHKLDRVFKELSGMIERVASGQTAKQPDPPGSSIWDDGNDPESIFGR